MRSQRYHRAESDLINAKHDRVYLDVERPRVCIKGPEVAGAPGAGYEPLARDDLFLFYELRAAAVDLRPSRAEGPYAGSRPFDRAQMAKRIEAQLATLEQKGVQHAVLSAFGCGAFLNPAHEVAQLYREAILRRRDAFELIAFAIYDPGCACNNRPTLLALALCAPARECNRITPSLTRSCHCCRRRPAKSPHICPDA